MAADPGAAQKGDLTYLDNAESRSCVKGMLK
jgi:hypothetical protein